jgi:stearoyl-CoA desaturase (Delta-9 desaturase)
MRTDTPDAIKPVIVPITPVEIETEPHAHQHEHVHEPMSGAMRAATLAAIVMPFVGLIVAGVLTWDRGFDALYLSLLLGMYVLTGLGITVGFHRQFTHRSFTTSRPVQAVLGVLGSMAVEGSLLRWVATHRCHHHHSDTEHDPHSPHSHGSGFFNMVRGAWRAHVGWMFERFTPDFQKYVSDYKSDRMVQAISRLFPLWVLLGMLIPGAIALAITGTWGGALLGVLWGGLVRTFFVHHVTWSINSVCHIWGARPFNCRDESRNNVIFGVLGFGEGWHNNHHAFPTSARHGLRWWQTDISYMVIWAMSKFGLAWNVRVPTEENIQRKLRSGE